MKHLGGNHGPAVGSLNFESLGIKNTVFCFDSTDILLFRSTIQKTKKPNRHNFFSQQYAWKKTTLSMSTECKFIALHGSPYDTLTAQVLLNRASTIKSHFFLFFFTRIMVWLLWLLQCVACAVKWFVANNRFRITSARTQNSVSSIEIETIRKRKRERKKESRTHFLQRFRWLVENNANRRDIELEYYQRIKSRQSAAPHLLLYALQLRVPRPIVVSFFAKIPFDTNDRRHITTWTCVLCPMQIDAGMLLHSAARSKIATITRCIRYDWFFVFSRRKIRADFYLTYQTHMHIAIAFADKTYANGITIYVQIK